MRDFEAALDLDLSTVDEAEIQYICELWRDRKNTPSDLTPADLIHHFGEEQFIEKFGFSKHDLLVELLETDPNELRCSDYLGDQSEKVKKIYNEAEYLSEVSHRLLRIEDPRFLRIANEFGILKKNA